MSIKHDDAAAAAVATAPRVTLNDIEAAIEQKLVLNGLDLVGRHLDMGGALTVKAKESLAAFTLGVVILKNGYVVIGSSAPASAANYDQALGERLAYENCLRQIWPLMGFALRQRLAAQADNLPEGGVS